LPKHQVQPCGAIWGSGDVSVVAGLQGDLAVREVVLDEPPAVTQFGLLSDCPVIILSHGDDVPAVMRLEGYFYGGRRFDNFESAARSDQYYQQQQTSHMKKILVVFHLGPSLSFSPLGVSRYVSIMPSKHYRKVTTGLPALLKSSE
jgi:hypothetical protein